MWQSKKMSICLWFDHNAREAVQFYGSVFSDFVQGKTSYYGSEGQETTGMEPGTVLVIDFEMLGQSFMAMNGGPAFKFNEAVSLVINCNSQQEIDDYWNRLTADGGQESECGWLKDKFGVSWQVAPVQLREMLQANGTAKDAVMRAMLKMKKLDLEVLQQASAG